MKTTSLLSFFLLPLLISFAWATASSSHEDFLKCLTAYSDSSTAISQVTYTPSNSSFLPIWQFSAQAAKYNTPSTHKPSVIVTPVKESQIQTVIFCSKLHGLEMRIRGGGHDTEGLSYRANVPFVMVDLINMRSITIDAQSKTAWVQGGANLGELYYAISQKSKTLLGFPGGVWSTVGVGGHVSGGGYGLLLRKYGLAADNVLDARIMDVNGQILDKNSMGEDLYWAIRGGGASSFGVVLAWKLRLVDVPETVTVFMVNRTLEQNATSIFHKWQSVAPTIDRDLFIRVEITNIMSGTNGRQTVQISFQALFQGEIDRLIPLMDESFPELGLTRGDCAEMSWIQAAVIFSGFSSQQSPEILLDRSAPPKLINKGKSDYAQVPIPIKGLEGMWRMILKMDPGTVTMVLNPYGGRADDFPASALPFPHRTGYIYQVLTAVSWDEQTPSSTVSRRLTWLQNYYNFLGNYFSKSPRAAYVNYIDLDLGVGTRTFEEASTWGSRYWGDNFKRLVQVKNEVDPSNFFKHPQSVPPFPSQY